jgi:hypothetical protein
VKKKIGTTLRNIRTWLLMGLLVAALSMLDFFLGCEKEKEEAVYYGPPPADDTRSDDDMKMLYGPCPIDQCVPADIDDTPDAQPEDLPPGPDMAWYGMPPTDSVEQTPLPDAQNPESSPLYGVQPFDACCGADSVDAVPDVQGPEMMILYGPQPADIAPQTDHEGEDAADLSPALEVVAWYGPQPMYGPQQ